MPTYQITAPDGKKYKINAPEGATKEQALEFFKGQFGAEPDKPEYDPTEGMSGLDKFAAGMGKGMVAPFKAIGQLAGVIDREDVDETKRLDAPLMDSGEAKAGNILGSVVAAAPTMAIPGVNTYTGAALVGAGMGALQPVGTDDSVAENALIGGVAGAGGQAAGNLIASGIRGTKAALSPFFESGRKEIAARMLQQTAADPAKAAAEAMNYTPAIQGVKPTLAQATLDPGLANLERSFTSGKHAAELSAQKLDNRAALVQALKGIAQDDAAKAAAVSAREGAVSGLYGSAKSRTLDVDGALMEIMQRPEVAEAFKQVQRNAQNRGLPIPKPAIQPASRAITATGYQDIPQQVGQISGDTLHSLKMALDDALSTGPQRGIGAQQADATRAARDALLGWIEQNIPEYSQARQTFSQMSKPINQMEVGQYLTDKLVPALSESGESLARLRPSIYAEALRNADNMVRQATDFNGATLANTMTKEQMQTFEGVAKELGREQSANDVGRAIGSNTNQNFATQNLTNQILGPLGLPGPLRAVAQAILQAPNRLGVPVFKGSDDEIRAMMAELLKDPKVAAQALNMSATVGGTEKLADALRRAALPFSLGTQAGQQ